VKKTFSNLLKRKTVKKEMLTLLDLKVVNCMPSCVWLHQNPLQVFLYLVSKTFTPVFRYYCVK